MVYADLGRFYHTRGFNSSPAACSTEGRDSCKHTQWLSSQKAPSMWLSSSYYLCFERPVEIRIDKMVSDGHADCIKDR